MRLFISAFTFLISLCVFGQEIHEGYTWQQSIPLDHRPYGLFFTPDLKYLILEGYMEYSVYSITKDGNTYDDVTGDLMYVFITSGQIAYA